MTLFSEATSPTHFKMGIMGMSGAGKTYTAGIVARGLHKLLVTKGLRQATAPVFFIETERGSMFELARFKREGIRLEVAPTRAFSDLVEAIDEIAVLGGIGIIDSVSAFWKEFCEAYARKMKRNSGLQFSDWSFLKGSAGWGKFTDKFVHSPCHLIMCGRAGFEYDLFTNEDTGKKEIQKTGIKMRAEGETAYEPDLLILMEKIQELERDGEGREVHKVSHLATVYKDRGHDLENQQFRDPTFETFLPHIERLSLGGKHSSVDLTRTSDSMIPADNRLRNKREAERRDVALDEVKQILVKHFTTRSNEDQEAKAALLEKHFGTRSWMKVATLNREAIENGRGTLWQELEGVPYTFGPKPEDGDAAQQAAGAAANETAGAAIDELLDKGHTSVPERKPVETESEQTRKDAAEASAKLAKDLENRLMSEATEDALMEVLAAIELVAKNADIPSDVGTRLRKLHRERLDKLVRAKAKAATPAIVPEKPKPETAKPEAKQTEPKLPQAGQKEIAANIERMLTEAPTVEALKEPREQITAAANNKLLSHDEITRLRRMCDERKDVLAGAKKGDLF